MKRTIHIIVLSLAFLFMAPTVAPSQALDSLPQLHNGNLQLYNGIPQLHNGSVIELSTDDCPWFCQIAGECVC